MKTLKTFIETSVLTKTKKFNNRATNKQWWVDRSYECIYNEIFEKTKFLDESYDIVIRCYCIVNDITTIELCEVCNKSHKLFNGYTSGFSNVCSRTCSLKSPSRIVNIKATKKERYGSETYVNAEKAKQTIIKRYGVEYTTQSQQMKEKSKQSKLEKYGDCNYNNLEKAKQTNIERYGVEYTSQAKSVIDKIQNKKNLINPTLRDIDWLIEENKTKSITQISEELDVTYRTVYLWYKKYNIDINFFAPDYSKTQKEIYDFVESLNFAVKLNDRNLIKPKELDILVPDKNLAIELNGCYWHRENKERHILKLNLCEEKGLRLLQFWDIEWYTKNEICKSILRSNLGLNKKIYARKCKIVSVSNSEYKQFMDENHIQGYAAASIRYGLMYDDILVSCISFSKSRFDKSKKYELVRYANKLNINVIGGFSKLLKFSGLTSILTYCDLRLFTGNMYKNSGFKFIRNTKPGYFYYKSGMVKSRIQCQKHKLEKELPNFDNTLTESENMHNNGWVRVFDCGNSVWEFDL